MQKILKILHHQNKNFDIRQNSTIIFRHGLDLPRVIGIIEYRGNVNFNLLSFPTYFHALSRNIQKRQRSYFHCRFTFLFFLICKPVHSAEFKYGHENRNDSRKNVRNRACINDSVNAEENRQNEQERQEKQDLPCERKEHAFYRFSYRGEKC